MAQRRMISLKVIDTDIFVDMPITARLLYYDLNMRADDDGFVASPKKIQRMVGCSDDDMKLLMAKRFIIPFESGVCVIKHWRIHNYIRGDRYTETIYKNEKAQLIESDGAYEKTNVIPNGNQMSYQMDTQVRLELGKDRLELNNNSGTSPQKKIFKPPTLEEVQAYCKERNNKVDPNKWYDFYLSKAWMIGKNKMRDWKAAVRTWEDNNKNKGTPKPVSNMTNRPYESDHGEQFIEKPTEKVTDEDIERIKKQRMLDKLRKDGSIIS